MLNVTNKAFPTMLNQLHQFFCSTSPCFVFQEKYLDAIYFPSARTPAICAILVNLNRRCGPVFQFSYMGHCSCLVFGLPCDVKKAKGKYPKDTNIYRIVYNHTYIPVIPPVVHIVSLMAGAYCEKHLIPLLNPHDDIMRVMRFTAC